MEFTSFNDRNRVLAILEQIKTAISQLKEWNAEVTSADYYYMSPGAVCRNLQPIAC